MNIKRVKLTPQVTALLRPVAKDKWSEAVELYRAGHVRLYGAFDGDLQGVIAAAKSVDGAIDVWLAAGTRAKEWAGDMEARVIADAKECGANLLRIHGRRGWVRILKHWHSYHDGDDWVLMRAI